MSFSMFTKITKWVKEKEHSDEMDKNLRKRNNLKNAFGRKNTFNSKELHKMTDKNIREKIVNKDKNRYQGSSKLKKDDLIKFIINKQVTEDNRKGGFDYAGLLEEMNH